MRSPIHEVHLSDDQGRPAGGATTGTGFRIEWQNGPLGRGADRLAPNGAFVEDIIAAAIGRIESYQNSPFNCRENAIALTKLQEAGFWLRERTEGRERRGVEGTHAQ